MGLWQSIKQLLLITVREIAGQEAQPGAAGINSQSICTRSFCALSGKFSCSRGKAGQSLVF